MGNFKDVKLTKREKALLEIIIAEVQGSESLEQARSIVDSWVTANDLHPEQVKTMSAEELQEFLAGV